MPKKVGVGFTEGHAFGRSAFPPEATTERAGDDRRDVAFADCHGRVKDGADCVADSGGGRRQIASHDVVRQVVAEPHVTPFAEFVFEGAFAAGTVGFAQFLESFGQRLRVQIARAERVGHEVHLTLNVVEDAGPLLRHLHDVERATDLGFGARRHGVEHHGRLQLGRHVADQAGVDVPAVQRFLQRGHLGHKMVSVLDRNCLQSVHLGPQCRCRR